MDSDGEENQQNNFAKQGGEALNLDDGAGFNESEEAEDVAQKKSSGAKAAAAPT